MKYTLNLGWSYNNEPFSYDPDRPTYYTEFLSFTLLKVLSDLQEEGFVLDDGEIAEHELDVWVQMWTAQSNVLIVQNTYFDDVVKTFNAKHAKLPAGPIDEFFSGLWEEAKSWLFKTGNVSGTLTKIFKWGAKWGTVAEIAVHGLCIGIDLLRYYYTSGRAFIERMKAENLELLKLSMTKANYQLRSEIITQHDVSVHNLLLQILETENAIAGNNITQSDFQKFLDLFQMAFIYDDGLLQWDKSILDQALLYKDEDGYRHSRFDAANSDENIIRCPYTGCDIYTKSLMRRG